LLDVAVTLSEAEHEPGETLAVCGTDSTSMLVLLEGKVELVTHSGTRVGTRSAGATVGDVACIGLFPRWMATARALTSCRVLEVTQEALFMALEGEEGGDLREGLARLEEERRSQVARGLPLVGFEGLGLSAEEPSVRVVALLSERLLLGEGETIEPERDDGPCGANLCFVHRGRLHVQLGEEEVLSFGPGAVLPEGMVAEFGARVITDSACEVYRIGRTDFELALASDPGAQKWVWQFKMREKDFVKKLKMRLMNVKGLVNTSSPTLKDEEIHRWAARLKYRTNQAAQLRQARAGFEFELVPAEDPPEGFHPMQVHGSSPHMVDEMASSTTSLPRQKKKGSGRLRLPAHLEANRGLMCYPVVKLPKIQMRSTMQRACSEPQLRVPPPRLVV